MKKIVFLITISSFILFNTNIVLCDSNNPRPDGMQTYEEFEAGIKVYPYEANPERVAQIMAGIPKLEKCMNKKSIKELLGPPDYSRLDFGPKGPGEKWLGSQWTYYLSKKSRLANIYDPRIHIFFDTLDRAHWIVPTDVENAQEIGSPRDKCT